jgi:hypothetical protein
MDINMQIRDQIGRELSESAAPPLGSLVSDALAAGVQRKQRRQYGIIGGTAAGIAALATIGVFAAGTGGAPTLVTPGAANVVAASAAPSSRAPSAAPSKPAAPSSPPPYAGQTTTGQSVIALLTALMPFKGHITEITFDASNGNADGSFLYDDGRGAATVNASVSDQPANYGSSVTGMHCPANDAGFTCTVRDLPDGNTARIMTMGPYDAKTCTEPKCGIKDLRVEVARTDGMYVIAEACNGPNGHGLAPTRAKTILSTNQLIAIATSPRWSLKMSTAFVAKAGHTVHES